MKTVIKKWGQEKWLEVNDKYCYKRIYFNAGCKCSLQFHEKKLETIFVVSGKGILWIDSDHEVALMGYEKVIVPGSETKTVTKVEISEGNFFTIKPYQLHRIEAITDLVTMEVSTPEVDDCIRVQDDYNRPHGRIESEHLTDEEIREALEEPLSMLITNMYNNLDAIKLEDLR